MLGLKKTKNLVLSALLLSSVFGLAPVGHAETLGWSEDGSVATLSSSSSPDSHKGWSEYYDEHTERAVGQTEWDDVYHYTRARMETWGGTVKADSKRVWGNNKTTARSPYALSDYSARTYWGH